MPDPFSESALRKLADLSIKNVSGVDDPAHMAPGWLVAKARKGSGGGKKFLAARAQPDGSVKMLFREGDESMSDVIDGLESIGIDPDTIAAMGGAPAKILVKARHDARHPQTGRYQKRPEPEEEDGKQGGNLHPASSTVHQSLVSWRHSGAVLPAFQR